MATPSQKPQWPIGQNSVLEQCTVSLHQTTVQTRQYSAVQHSREQDSTVQSIAVQCSPLCRPPLAGAAGVPSLALPLPQLRGRGRQELRPAPGRGGHGPDSQVAALARGLPLPPGQVPHLPLQRGQPPGGGAPTVHRHAGQGEEARREESDQVKAN